MNADETVATSKNDPNVDALAASASRWIKEALSAWAEGDYEAIAMLAPIAVEHLGKAALWHRHPSLLVPLTNNSEESLHILTHKPELANLRLRTIGLATLLERLDRCLTDFPLPPKRRKRLVDIRNGSVHAGLKSESRYVLSDALTACRALLLDLGISEETFYGEQRFHVAGLLDETRGEVEALVAAKKAKARNHLSELEKRLGAEVFEETCAALEAQAANAFDPDDYTSLIADYIAMNHECPECGSQGRLLGRLDAIPDIEWDVEPNGDGTYHSYPSGEVWDLYLNPDLFGCNVCRLVLLGRDELAAGLVPSTRHSVDEGDMDPDFDLHEFARSQYEERD